ncbi:MAG: divalent-cation tolerance protein CutA [Dissulfurispiraceae bacterium]|jgi:periplasmic divalent cation tolerance protein
MDAIVIYITAPNEEMGAKLARTLVEERLAGCVNIIKPVRSIYRWQENIEDDTEVLMIVKTQKNLFASLNSRVKELHSYSVPEVIAVPVVDGSEEYLKWLEEVTGKDLDKR